ncbi:MAG: Eco57I restriction-modification methylase domain-containing protein [Candidatus Methanomethylophilaceae archaeon]|nr:Eco57I restriction-modification methylase domain-containing protein [Candidatus Methanomethylophilaceae archaeon]
MRFPGGVVYTKEWVVELMLDEAGYTNDRNLSRLRILEPACGCGAFVVPIVRRLCNSLKSSKQTADSLKDCIHAMDIDESSVAICRDEVSKILLFNGFSYEDAQYLTTSWIKAGDSLLESDGGYDVVIGNPPYVRSEDVPADLRRVYMEMLKTVTMGTDLFVGFIENGLRRMSPNGKLCFICADRWMQNKYGGKLRGFISESYGMELICRMHDVDVFESEVSAYPAITLIGAKGSSKCKYVVCSDGFGPEDVDDFKKAVSGLVVSSGSFSIADIWIGGTDPWLLSDPGRLRLLEEIRSRFPSIEESGVKIGIGVATGRDDVFITTDPNLVESECMIPLIKKEDIEDGCTPEQAVHWLVNPWDEEGRLIDLAGYPKAREYLESHRDSLEKRHVVKKDRSKWYRTIDKVNPSLKSKPKLLMQDMSRYPDPFFDDGSYYPSHNMYWITSDTWDLKVLGGVLLSNQMEFFIDAIGVKMRGNTMRCQAQYLRMLHVPHPKELTEADSEEFKSAFEKRDRDMATTCMQRILNKEVTMDAGGNETGFVEVV